MSKPRYNTPEEAEAAFYSSFENGNPDAMMAVWDQTDDIVCVHPFGTRLKGVDAVRGGWEGLLTGKQRLTFRVESSLSYSATGIAVNNVLERIHIRGNDSNHTPIIATNAYRHTADGWRMILHHASPQPRPDTEGDNNPAIEQSQQTIH